MSELDANRYRDILRALNEGEILDPRGRIFQMLYGRVPQHDAEAVRRIVYRMADRGWVEFDRVEPRNPSGRATLVGMRLTAEGKDQIDKNIEASPGQPRKQSRRISKPLAVALARPVSKAPADRIAASLLNQVIDILSNPPVIHDEEMERELWHLEEENKQLKTKIQRLESTVQRLEAENKDLSSPMNQRLREMIEPDDWNRLIK